MPACRAMLVMDGPLWRSERLEYLTILIRRMISWSVIVSVIFQLPE
jgi:hypothetical protein